MPVDSVRSEQNQNQQHKTTTWSERGATQRKERAWGGEGHVALPLVLLHAHAYKTTWKQYGARALNPSSETNAARPFFQREKETAKKRANDRNDRDKTAKQTRETRTRGARERAAGSDIHVHIHRTVRNTKTETQTTENNQTLSKKMLSFLLLSI